MSSRAAPTSLRLATATAMGAILGAVLLLVLPESSFEAVVPALILLGCALVLISRGCCPGWVSGPGHTMVVRWSGSAPWRSALRRLPRGGSRCPLIALLGVGLDETLQRVNAAKNVLAGWRTWSPA